MGDRIPIFRKVRCKAYMKKQSDGVRLVCTERRKAFTFPPTQGDDRYIEDPVKGSVWSDDRDIHVVAVRNVYEDGEWKEYQLADLSNFEGDYVEKRYRFRVEEEFEGFLVGITLIATTGRIGTDYGETHVDCYDDYYYHLFKDKSYEKVGVVYFKNNAKRYVLIDDMEEVKENANAK